MEPIRSLDPGPRWARIRLIAGIALIGFALLALFAWPLLGNWTLLHTAGQAAALLTTTPSPFAPEITETFTPTFTPSPTSTPAAPLVVGGGSSLDGLQILSLSEAGYARLFAHQLVGVSFVRLTSGDWDDVQPAIEPDGERLAFASNRNGHWDLFLLDLETGETTQLSNDAAYEGWPSWSSDGWLAYENYANDDLEINIRPADGSLDPISVSISPGLDYAPAWRAHTQQIAFISDRSGTAAVWVVNLVMDGPARFTQIVPSDRPQASPAWSPDGAWLAWSQQDADGAWRIYARNMDDDQLLLLGAGEEPTWNPEGSVVMAMLRTEYKTYLTAYALDGSLALAPELLSGDSFGAAWGSVPLLASLPPMLRAAAQAEPDADWLDALDAGYQHSSNARQTVALDDVFAPDPQLSETIIEPYDALRARAAQLLGWDALSSLEDAFVALDEPLQPSRQQDWLYTGRALALRSGLLTAGWMQAVREDYAGQTYWRIYLRTADQSGGMGQPLTAFPWNFAARYTGAETSYQAGGKLAGSVPAGYWVDFTALAAQYGFERLPAQTNWRNFYPGALFNEFALRSDLSWEQAMLQLYSPAEVATAASAAP
jgi:TolB protein